MTAVAPAMSAPAPDLAAQIETEHQAALDAASTADSARQTALRHAFACGNLLIEAKAQVEIAGGSWTEWVKAHLSFGGRQAQKYRRFSTAARVQPELLTSHSTLDSALNSIAEPKSGSGSRSAPKSEGPKLTERPADQVVAAVRALNVKLEPAAIEIATTLLTEEQRVDLRQHLPD